MHRPLLPIIETRQTAYCIQNSALLLHEKQAVTFFSEEVAFIRSSQQGSHAALQFAPTEKGKGRDCSDFLDRWLLTLKGQRNCKKKNTTIAWSPRRRMASCVLSSYHMFRDIFFPLFLSGFFLPSTSSTGLLFVSKHLATHWLSFLPSTCFDLQCLSASNCDKGRDLPFHLLARLLGQSSRAPLFNLPVQFKKPYSKLPQRVC